MPDSSRLHFMGKVSLALTTRFLATRSMMCRPVDMASREAEEEKEEDNILMGAATFHAALEGTPALDLIRKVRSS